MKATKVDLEQSIKYSLSLLDDRMFERMCEDGKQAVLEMANLVGFDGDHSTCFDHGIPNRKITNMKAEQVLLVDEINFYLERMNPTVLS